MTPRLSVVVPGGGDGGEAARRLARIEAVMRALEPRSESIAPDASGGFGAAIRAGLEAASGDFIMTVDPAVVDPADAMEILWANRSDGDVIVASRYVAGARVRMPAWRSIGSRAVNRVFSRGLSVEARDVSSGFRLYRAGVLREQSIRGTDFDILPEMLVRALAGGWRVREVPLRAALSGGPAASIRLVRAYARTFGALWRLRNSIHAADYDARAHDSRIPLQRYWQRQRFRHITDLVAGQGPVLDVGCGSSRIIGALPPGSVALDLLANKLRYDARYGRFRVRASGGALPFADASFGCVLCSQVIEHVPAGLPILDELQRVLKPGGRLVLGTPDYSRWEWIWMEKAYGFVKSGGYAVEHITRYTRDGLLRYFGDRGYAHEDTRYILRGELILAFRKSGTQEV
jgi:SAM-dependent methyltransferase